MTVCANDIFQGACEIFAANGAEPLSRAVVGRAYYASYHHCLDFHDALNSPGLEPEEFVKGSHERLIHRLIRPTCSKDRQGISKQAGYQLRTLKLNRFDADYELGKTISRGNAETAIENARVLLDLAK